MVTTALPGWAQTAPAQPSADPRAAEAKQRYENGMAHFNLEEWDAAIDEWKSGYRAKPVPQFLYNIAQAYRLSKHYEEALNFYQRYLRAEPHAPNHVEVEGHIAKLTTVVAQERRAQNAPPASAMTVRPKENEGTPRTGEPLPSPAPVAVVAVAPSPAPVAVVVVQKEPEKPTPITKKKWFWPTIGAAIGVVVIVVIVGAAVGASGGGDNAKVLPLARF